MTSTRAGAPARAGAALLALLLAFGCAVVVLVMLDVGDTPRCGDTAAVRQAFVDQGGGEVECFDGSQAQKVATLALGWLGAAVAAVGVLAALGLTFTGRGGRRLVILTIAAILLSGLSILVGSV